MKRGRWLGMSEELVLLRDMIRVSLKDDMSSASVVCGHSTHIIYTSMACSMNYSLLFPIGQCHWFIPKF